LTDALGSEDVEGAVVLAIVSPDSEQDIADLLLADLAEMEGISLVDRNEIDRIREELELRDWSLSVGLEESRFAGADVLVLTERPSPENPVLLRLISTHTGWVMGAVEVPQKLSTEWFGYTSAWIAETCRFDRVTGVPVVMMRLVSASGNLANEMVYSAKLLRELYFRPEIAVLERWRLRDAVFENLLKDSVADFSTARWILEGKLFDQTEKIGMEISLRRVGSDSSIFLDRYDVEEGYAEIADDVSLILDHSGEGFQEVVNKPEEVSHQIDRGKWAMKWSDYDQAIISFENAIAIAPRRVSIFECYLAAAYFMRGSQKTVISQGKNNNRSSFRQGILDLCAAFSLLTNASNDPLDVNPMVYGLSADMLIAVARSLTAAAALDPASIEMRQDLKDLRRYSKQVYRNLLAVEELDSGFRKRMTSSGWIKHNSSEHEYYNATLAMLISGGLWEESREAAVDALIEATKRLQEMPRNSRASIYKTAVKNRSDTDAWIARWPGGFDLPEDMKYWTQLADGEGGLVELIPALAAVQAATPMEGSPFTKNDPSALEEAARRLEKAVRNDMEKFIEWDDPDLLSAIPEVIIDAWYFSTSSRAYQGARNALESAFLAAKYEVLDSGEEVDVQILNLFNRPQMVPLEDRARLKRELLKCLSSLDGIARSRLQKEYAVLDSELPLPPNGGPMPRFSGPPGFSAPKGIETMTKRREKAPVFIRSGKGFPIIKGGSEVKILGLGKEPSRWLFKERSEEFNHPRAGHALVSGDGRIWVVWAYSSRLIVEHFSLDSLTSTLWHPPYVEGELYFEGDIAFLDGKIYIYSNRTLLWTSVDEENWFIWTINSGDFPSMRMVDRMLFLVSSSAIQKLDPESQNISVLVSDRLGIGKSDELVANGLKFINEPGLRSRPKFPEFLMEKAKDRRVFREMADRGELRTDLSAQAAFWMVYQERGPRIAPERYDRRKYGPAIKELSSMGHVLAAGADSEAIWLLYRKEDKFFLGKVPWNRKESPKEYSVRVPEFSDTLLVTPEAVVVYNRNAFPAAVYLKKDLR